MEIPNRQAEIDALTRKYLTDLEPEKNGHAFRAASPGTHADEVIIEKARAERKGKFERLWNRDLSDLDGDHSRADDSFVHKLWSYTQDEAQIYRIHAMSGLSRPKSARPDYLRRSINRASKKVTWFYEWPEERAYSRSLSSVGEKKPTNPNYPDHRDSSDYPDYPDYPEPISAAQLLELDLGPVRWAVPDVLPEGVTLLAGKPKQGKSWAALGLCEAIAAGGVAFGTKKVEQGETLYLALEDNQRRMQKRLKKVLDGRGCPSGMYVDTEWPRLGEGGAEALNKWLTEHPGARLVVIDTLAKIRKPTRGKNVYQEDYSALEVLLPMAAQHGVAIVVVHHLRKGEAADAQDEISGSTGLVGGVDGYLILRRKPGSKGPTLFVDGRDIEEPTEYALHWNLNTATWTIEGTAEEVHISKERADILLELNRSPETMTPKEIAAATGQKYENVKVLLRSMLQDDQVTRSGVGKYEPSNRTNPDYQSSTGYPDSPDRNGEKPPEGNRVTGVIEDGKETSISFAAPPGRHKLDDLKSSPGEAKRRLTEDEARRVQDLIADGMAPKFARAEVTGEELEVGEDS